MNKKLKLWELNRKTEAEFRAQKKFPIVVVLDDIRSLNNIGSFFRTGDAFNIEKIFLCGITAVPPHRDIHKTALGSTDTVDWEYNKQTLDFDKICQWFKDGEKKRENWLIGTEHEKFLFKRNEFKRLSYEDLKGIKFILNKIAEEEDWEKISENNNLIGLKHDHDYRITSFFGEDDPPWTGGYSLRHAAGSFLYEPTLSNTGSASKIMEGAETCMFDVQFFHYMV